MRWKPFFIARWDELGRRRWLARRRGRPARYAPVAAPGGGSTPDRWLARRRGRPARRAARIMKGDVVPGTPPLAGGEWLLLLAGGMLALLTLLGGAAFLAPAGGALR